MADRYADPPVDAVAQDSPSTTPHEEEATMTIATSAMCAEAFSTLVARLQPDRALQTPCELPDASGGVFVTWSVPRHTARSTSPRRQHTYTLRGCIGTLKPCGVASAIPRYALHAAFHDPRFDPIGEAELPGLKVGVSVLSMFEKADHAYDWDVGVHGIILEFGDGRFSATYLPEVCKDHSWSKEYCVQSLAEKAGYKGRLEGSLLDQAIVTRYQSTKAEMLYEQYLELGQRHQAD